MTGGGGAVKFSHVGRFVSLSDLLDNEIHSRATLCVGLNIAPQPEMGTVAAPVHCPVPQYPGYNPPPPLYFLPVDIFSISCHILEIGLLMCGSPIYSPKTFQA